MAHATMAAASALTSGTFSSHLSRPHAAGDSRLLTNLIKSERTYISNLHASVMSAHAASSALSAWGTSEAPDVTECSARLADLLSASAEVQSTHVSAIEGYRAALKDVSDREASIRNVVRDRDILVGRLIKASNKSVNTSGKSRKSPEERAEKVHIAQRELQACEGILTQEEAALVGVKRRTFKEALTMRMKTMGDAGAAMVDAAKEAILLLDEFDSNDYQRPQTPHYDEQGNVAQDWYTYPDQNQQAHEEANDERMAVNHPNFENSSVTPSQSASQIYQPQFAQRNSTAYSAPFRGIGENDGEAQRSSRQQGDESDSDDEDWKRSFAQDSNTAHQGVPAPHQISADAGAHRTFIPYVTPGPTPPNKESDRQSTTGSRAPSMQSKRKSKAAERIDQFGPPTTIAMPPIPTARRLQADGVYMEPVPTAPKLYMPGASGDQADSSVGSDDGRAGGRQMGQNRGDGASSDGERTAKQSSRPGAKRSNSFFGKMGRLFKTDVKGEPKKGSGKDDRKRRESVSSSTWNTRTDALVKETRRSAGPLPPSNQSRKQNALNNPLMRNEPDSSDEEPIDESNAVRVTNPKRAMWQNNQKASSDVGTRNILSNELRRPASVKRTPSATVTAGPASWKSTQEGEGAAKQQSAAPALLRSNSVTNSVTPSLKKKKKKAKAPSVAGGSEIGTDSTRTKMAVSESAKQPQRSSVIVAGDASAGVRRSDSLDYGEGARLPKKSKKRSAGTAQSLHDNSSVKGLGVMGQSDRQSKFSTSNWVAKSNVDEAGSANTESQMGMVAVPPLPTAVPAIAAPAPPASPKRQSTATAAPITPSKLKQSHTAASDINAEEEKEPKHIPQPSATMSPPLKPSLKVPGSVDLARSGSAASSITGSYLPSLPPPMSAPPPVTSMGNLDDIYRNGTAPQLSLTEDPKRERMSIEEDKRFDGTGRLGVADYQQDSPDEKRNQRKSKPFILPKIDMPSSEPFRVDYDSKDGGKTGNFVREGSSGNVLTPGESHVYQSYMMQQNETSPVKAQESAAQPSGVTRFTDRIASVGRGVLGMRSSPPKQASSSKTTASPADAPITATSPQSPTLPVPPPGQLSRTYSDQNILNQGIDSSEDEEVPKQMVTPAAPTVPTTAAVPAVSAVPASTNGFATQAPESVDGGSGLGRRKSVRMAPDVKLPPESPVVDAPGARKDYNFNYTTPGSQLSSRIAPPPQAPPRISNSDARSIDIGANPREVQGWSIRAAPLDDSSEEDEDEYQKARKQFGSISRSWGKSTKKNTGPAGAASAANDGGSIKKKKKKTASSNSGYNPAIPLPKGMEVVGRSNSVRR